MEYGYSLDIIELALKRTTSKVNPTFDYFNKIIIDWHERGFNTVSEIENYLQEQKQKNKDIKKLEKTASYNNYDQRKYDNLNSLYANLN